MDGSGSAGDADESGGFFATLVGSLPEATVVTDAGQDIVFVNEAFTTMTGYTRAESLGRNCRFLQGAQTDRSTVAALRHSLQDRRPFRGALLNYRKDGTSFWNEIAIGPAVDASGAVTHFVSVQRDGSETARDRGELMSLLSRTDGERDTLRALLDIARSLPQETSTARVVQSVAEAIPRLCGVDRSAVALWDSEHSRLSITGHAGWPPPGAEELAHVHLSPSTSPELAEIIVGRSPVLVTRSGTSEWARTALDRFGIDAFAAVPVHSGGAFRGLLLGYWSDSTAPAELHPELLARFAGLAGLTAVALDNARLLEETRTAALRDPLTGLQNRAALEQRLSEALLRASEQAPAAVIFCDVDGLKRTNDTFGHAVGDIVLKEVAERLQSALGSADTVARVGGDEFVIMLQQVRGEAEMEAILARLEAALTDPVSTGGRAVSFRLSMGLAFSSDPLHGPSPTMDASALIHAADMAMYQRKSRGTRLLPGASPGRLQRLGAALEHALDRGEITVHYQPQIDLRSDRVVAVEALARWTHPTLGPVDPDEFIPMAERSGEIARIGRFVLGRACDDIAIIRRMHPDIQVAVNVSNDQLDVEGDGFARSVRDVLASAGLPAESLTVEITESTLPADRPAALRQLVELRSIGAGIALDDFGTGYSSLQQLRDAPATELKIDRSYVQRPPLHGRDLLAGLLALAHGLDLRVVAEGVSTAQQLDRVRSLGFDRAQGFAIAAPMSRAALIEHLGSTLSR